MPETPEYRPIVSTYVLVTIPLSRGKASYGIGRIDSFGGVTLLARCAERSHAVDLLKQKGVIVPNNIE